MPPNNPLPVHGNEKTMNLNHLILTNIQSSPYFKVNLYELKTYHEVIDEIYYKVDHLEPWEKGSRKTAGQTGMCGGVRGVGAGGIVSSAYCLLYKLFTLKLTRKQLNGLITHTDSPYIRGLGFMYIRYTQPPSDMWDWYGQYLEDDEELDVKAGGGQIMTIGEMVRQWLVKIEWYSTLFPRVPVPVQKTIQMKLREYDAQHANSSAAVMPAEDMGQAEDYNEDEGYGQAERTSRSERDGMRAHERESDSNRHKERDRDREERDRERIRAERDRERERERDRERQGERDRDRDRDRRHGSYDVSREIQREKERQRREKEKNSRDGDRGRDDDLFSRDRDRERDRERDRYRDESHRNRERYAPDVRGRDERDRRSPDRRDYRDHRERERTERKRSHSRERKRSRSHERKKARSDEARRSSKSPELREKRHKHKHKHKSKSSDKEESKSKRDRDEYRNGKH